MNSDFKERLRTFSEEGVDYLVVGAYAVIPYCQPRYWVSPKRIGGVSKAHWREREPIAIGEATRSDVGSKLTEIQNYGFMCYALRSRTP